MVPMAADYPFLDVFWTMIIFFFWVIWIWIVHHGPDRRLPEEGHRRLR